jgi:hypothetical protein
MWLSCKGIVAEPEFKRQRAALGKEDTRSAGAVVFPGVFRDKRCFIQTVE